jgi:hypothetical protein
MALYNGSHISYNNWHKRSLKNMKHYDMWQSLGVSTSPEVMSVGHVTPVPHAFGTSEIRETPPHYTTNLLNIKLLNQLIYKHVS